MLIETVSEQRLTKGVDAEIARLLGRCFKTDFGGRSFFQTRHSWRHLIRDKADVVAHMAVQLRAVRLGDDLLTVAGIADVATDPVFRGQGLASALLKTALAASRESVATHVLLFGTARLYAAAGFRTVTNPLLYADLTGARTLGLCRDHAADHLQVLDLLGQPWDDEKPLDLLGGQF